MRCLFLATSIAAALHLTALAGWAAPAIAVASPEHDFGTILQGETVRHAFVFTNRGNETLTVDKVTSSCGCTAALASAQVLAPGESGELRATFDSARFRGPVKKTVYLYTNDPSAPLTHLHLKGTVREEVAIEPSVVNFGTITPKSTVRATVNLVNQGDRDIRFDSLSTTTPELAARLGAKTVAPGGRIAVELTLTPKPGQSRFSGYVLFKADGALSHDLRIPVYADLGG